MAKTDDEVPEISNPRRILAVSLDDEANHLSRVLKDLTNATPQPTSTTLAGTSHDLPLQTPYYKATVPIWIDLIASPAGWADSFLSPEAKEVLAVLGGLVLVFSLPPPPPPPSADTGTESGGGGGSHRARTKDLIVQVGRVAGEKGLGGWAWDGVGLAVGVGAGDGEEWDDICVGAGLEFVHLTGNDEGARNEFGEKTGIPRIREALEANDWAQLSDDLSDFGDFKDPSDLKNEDDDDDGKELDPESLDFGFDKADFEGLRASIWTSGMPQPDDDDENEPEKEKNQETKKQPEKEANGNESGTRAVNAGGEGQERPETETELDDGDVEKMESMMRRLVAVREAGEGMGYEQRRRMAARAVEDVMKEL